MYYDPYTNTERSFDSVDTTTTDGARSSESSRVEFTTSIDSTTTNESDSYYKRQILRDAKDDSGYKSIEQNPVRLVSPSTAAPSIIISPTSGALDSPGDETGGATGYSPSHSEVLLSHYSRTASSRRRDFQTRSSGEQQQQQLSPNIQASYSSFELESTDSNNMASCESIAEKSDAGKSFLKVFQSSSGKKYSPKRDYSVDEKTDAIFKEFARYDPKYDENVSASRSRSTPSMKLSSTREFKSTESQVNWNKSVEHQKTTLSPCPSRNQLATNKSVC